MTGVEFLLCDGVVNYVMGDVGIRGHMRGIFDI